MKRTRTNISTAALVALAAALALPGGLIAHPPDDGHAAEQMAEWAEKWARWGEELGERWAEWGEEFGERFGEEWGEKFGERFGEEWGEELGRRWAERAEEMAARAEHWEEMGERWEQMGGEIERQVAQALAAIDWEGIEADIGASLEGLDELELERMGERIERQMEQLERQLERMERRLEEETP